MESMSQHQRGPVKLVGGGEGSVCVGGKARDGSSDILSVVEMSRAEKRSFGGPKFCSEVLPDR